KREPLRCPLGCQVPPMGMWSAQLATPHAAPPTPPFDRRPHSAPWQRRRDKRDGCARFRPCERTPKPFPQQVTRLWATRSFNTLSQGQRLIDVTLLGVRLSQDPAQRLWRKQRRGHRTYQCKMSRPGQLLGNVPNPKLLGRQKLFRLIESLLFNQRTCDLESRLDLTMVLDAGRYLNRLFYPGDLRKQSDKAP